MKFGCLNTQNANKCPEEKRAELKMEARERVRHGVYLGWRKQPKKNDERNVDLLAHQRTLNMAMD